MAEEKKNRSPEEQAAAFKAWLQNKTLRDTAFSYLERLDPVHAVQEENLKQVTVALRAAERLLGDSEGGGGADDYGDSEAIPKKKQNTEKPQKTLKSAWASWTMKHHTFDNVKLSEDFVNNLTGGAKELLRAEDESDPKKGYTIDSLKYNFPEIPKKKGLQPRPMTNDQKLFNTQFMGQVRRVWKEASAELEEQINAAKQNGGRVDMPAFVEDGGAVDLGFGKEESKDPGGGDAKADAKGDGDKGGEAKGSVSAAARAPSKEDPAASSARPVDEGKLQLKILNAISIRRMREWLEEDEDRRLNQEKEDIRSKRLYAKKEHEAFVAKHKDLDESRRREERREKRKTDAVERERNEAVRARNKESFERWVVQKEMREQATKCLQLMDAPRLDDHELTSTTTSTHKTVMETGRALKAIDRTLLPDWAKWADEVLPFNTAVVLWDSFEPKACDVHCAAHSYLKDTFHKLLRKDIDVGEYFKKYVEKLIRYTNQDDLVSDEDIAKCKLTRKQVAKVLKEMGIHMKPMEMRLLIDAFDSNGDGSVTFKEFNDFVKADRSESMNSKCCYNTTCHRTGMANAYSRSEPTANQLRKSLASGGSGRAESKDAGEGKEDYEDDFADTPAAADSKDARTRTIKLANGESRIVVELADRIAREKLLVRYGALDDSGYDDDLENVPLNCSYCTWTTEKRKSGLNYLVAATQLAREEEVLKKMLTEGTPPSPPALTCNLPPSRGDDDEESCTSLTLEWEPVQGDLVSFYSLETSGPTGTSKVQPYTEVCRDPPSADPHEQLSCSYTLRNLQPGTSYQFRIRGFNGFGPGEYTYRIFTTRSSAPPAPRVVKLSSDSVTLRWVFSETFYKRLAELEALFRGIDTDHSGQVSREELASALDAHSDSSAALRTFLNKKAGVLGVDISRGCGALFDVIEGDDDGNLSWEEFETFFLTAGWADTNKSLAIGASQTVRASANGGARANKKGADLTYVVEQCASEFDRKWTVCLSTAAGYGTISRLRPGGSYRFRVHSVNKDGIAGPNSDDVIVHCMLETPATPKPVDIDAKSITLAWKKRGDTVSLRDPTTINKLLSDWSGNHDDGGGGGVSIEMAFAKYDRNRSGDIDAAELALMLEDLGVEANEERLAEAFSVLDTNGDGIISFDEFAAWWRRDEVTYVVKRSETIHPATTYVSLSNSHDAKAMEGLLRRSNAAANSHSVLSTVKEDRATATNKTLSQDTPLVVYRGEQNRYEVLGIEPNRLYHFRLRQVGTRCNSLISAPLVVMSAPLPPSQPLVIDVGATSVRVKWYAPTGGAYKFLVQLRAVKSATSLQNSNDPAPGASNGWIPVFNGQETLWTSTTMVPDTEYDVRVLGVNYQGIMGKPSASTTFTTMHRGTVAHAEKRDTDSDFSIECSGDLCTGDTILITERLFVKDDGKSDGPDVTKSITSKSKIGGKAALRVDMSVTSIHSDTSGALPPGAYIGERTIAAHIVKDNYRTCRDCVVDKGLTPKDYKRFGKFRYLMLEVMWQRASNDACKPYELKKGEVIERSQARLEEFEVFRTPWRSEDKRVPLSKEWASQVDSYITADCAPL